MMNTESSSSIIPTSSSSLLASAGRVAGKKPKEEEPPLIVSSSSVSVQPATSGYLKQEEAAVKTEEFGPEVNIDHEARCKNDWEPGNWCWLLDEHDTNLHTTIETAPVHVAVKAEEEDAEAVTEEETEMIKSQQENDDVVASAPQFVSSLSSSPPTPGIRSTKEETKEQNTTNNKLRRREDVAVTENEGLKSEQEDDAVDDDDDDNNNHKICHRTDRSVKSNRKSDHGGSGDNTITNSSSIGTQYPDTFDDNTWRAGSWCWEKPTTHSGSRSTVVASVASRSTWSSRRSTKRKASEHCRESMFADGVRNENNKHNNTNIAVTHRRRFDRQHHDPGDDNWTTSCWCWEPPNTNSGISGVASAAAALTFICRRKKQKRSEQSRKSKYFIPSKNHTTIGNHTNNNSTDFDVDDDADDILECHGDHDDNHDDDDDDDDGTDSDYDSVDDDDDEYNDERVSNNASRGNSDMVTGHKINSDRKIGSDNTTTKSGTTWNKMYSRLVRYKKTYNSIYVTKKFDDKHRLQHWIWQQRYYYNKKVLCVDRINRLESIGFVWNPLEAKWIEMYDRLVKYRKQYKSTCVPEIYPEYIRFGKWVSTQRTLYKTNHPALTIDRISKLNSIGFVWNAFDAQWMEMYKRLVAYKKQYKTTCIPTVYPADPQLGNWVSTQRKNYNTNKSYLTADRISQLDSIGFVWKIRDK